MAQARGPDRDDDRPDPGDEEDASHPAFPLLHSGSSREILAKLHDGDPLELRARCQARLQSQALMISVDRLHLRVLARVAHAGSSWNGHPPFDVWLGDRISLSVRELQEEDREAVETDLEAGEVFERRYAFLVDWLGIEPPAARAACVAFNSQPYAVRRTFFALIVERMPFNRYIAEGNGTPVQVHGYLRRALRAVGLGDEPGPFGPRKGAGDGG